MKLRSRDLEIIIGKKHQGNLMLSPMLTVFVSAIQPFKQILQQVKM